MNVNPNTQAYYVNQNSDNDNESVTSGTFELETITEGNDLETNNMTNCVANVGMDGEDGASTGIPTIRNLYSGDYMMTEGLSTCVGIVAQRESEDNDGTRVYPTALIHANGADILNFEDDKAKDYIKNILENMKQGVGGGADIIVSAAGGFSMDEVDDEDYSKLRDLLLNATSEKGMTLVDTNIPALDIDNDNVDEEDYIDFHVGTKHKILTQHLG